MGKGKSHQAQGDRAGVKFLCLLGAQRADTRSESTSAHREEAAATLEAHGRRAPPAASKVEPEARPGGGGVGGQGATMTKATKMRDQQHHT